MSQILFFQKIKESLPPNRSFVDELNEVLSITNDGCYRRIRGETAITFSETEKLCKAFGVSFDMFVQTEQNCVMFDYTSTQNTENFLQNYFSNLHKQLSAIKQIEKKKITYACEGIPIFYYFNFEELTRFKLFFWKRSVLELPQYKSKTYSPELVSDEMVKQCKDLTTLYNSIPVTEIWTDETVLGNIKQIEFAWESGVFAKKDDALLICSQLNQTLSMIKKMAELSAKFSDEKKWAENENTFELFKSDVNISVTCILATTETGKMCFYSPHTFNTMGTSNETFCSDTEQWLKSIISKSEIISGSGEKQRARFFNSFSEKLNLLEQKIKAS